MAVITVPCCVQSRLSELSVSYEELETLPPTFSSRDTFHCLDLTWSQWTSVLTHNILARNIKVHTALSGHNNYLSLF